MALTVVPFFLVCSIPLRPLSPDFLPAFLPVSLSLLVSRDFSGVQPRSYLFRWDDAIILQALGRG